jgi:hypothetical protein
VRGTDSPTVCFAGVADAKLPPVNAGVARRR